MLDDPKNYLSASELSEMINELTSTDLHRLDMVAGVTAKKCGLPPRDILQEAFVRALEGKRRCPSDVNVLHFLVGIMRSIASSDAKSFSRHPHVSLQTEKYDDGPEHEELLPDTTPSMTESGMIARISLKQVKELIPPLFESDPEPIQFLVEGILDGMDPEELKDVSGLYGNEYNSARRLFRRRLKKAFPGGWGNA